MSTGSSPATREYAVKLYQSGLSAIQVGQKMGRNPTTIYTWLKKAGVERRATPSTPKETRVAALEMHANGATDAEVAKHFGVSTGTISKWRSDFNKEVSERRNM